jgi:hypothetical protein
MFQSIREGFKRLRWLWSCYFGCDRKHEQPHRSRDVNTYLRKACYRDCNTCLERGDYCPTFVTPYQEG